ncbi:MAG TPA: hypothetical protein VIR58_12450, partial [Acidimicrobiales bacterium]
ELRETLAAVAVATAPLPRFEDKAVEAALLCLERLEGSVVDHLIRHDPASVLPLLTTEAGPLIALARSAIAPQLLRAGVATDPDQAAIAAETMARLGLSFVLTRDTVVPIGDPEALRRAAEDLVRPLVRPVA